MRMKEKNTIINDRLGGGNALPIKYVRESLRDTDNPVINFLRTYPGQIIMAFVTFSCPQPVSIPTGCRHLYQGCSSELFTLQIPA